MTAPPLLSVVVPVKDVRPWIDETLASLLGQDLADIEVIVVDNGSSDGTRDAVARIASGEPRLRLVDAAGEGGGPARNLGAALAAGRYLAFCDGDDLVSPHGYAALVASLEASGSAIALGDYLKFSPVRSWRPTEGWPAYGRRRTGIRIDDEPTLLYGRPCWNRVFRRDFWERVGVQFPDAPRSNDIVPVVATLLAADAIDVVDEVVYLYRERVGTGSMSAAASHPASLLSYLAQETECAARIARHGSEALREIERRLVLDRDGWVHLARFLRARPRDRSRDHEVGEALRRLLATADADPGHASSPAKRLVVALAAADEFDAAAAAVDALVDPPPAGADELAAWLALFDARERGELELPRDAAPSARLDEALRVAVLAEHGADEAAIAAARAARRAGYPVAGVPEFAGMDDVGDAELAARLAATRRLAPTVSRLATGRALRFEVVARSGHRLEPAVWDAEHGRALSPGTAPPRDHGLRLAALDPHDGAVHSAVLDAALPPYDPFDAFLHEHDRSGGAVRRRDGWVVRALRRALRG